MGDVAIAIPPSNAKSIEEVRAQIAAFEANPVAPDAPNSPEPAPQATSKTQEPPVPPQPETTPPAKEPDKETQQPKAATEKAVPEPPKTAEPAKEKEIDWKSRYIGLQRKFDQTFTQKKSGPEVTPPAATVKPPTQENVLSEFSPEFKKQALDAMEKDPIETIINIVRREISPIKSKIDYAEARGIEAQRMEGLDRLVSEGHDWLKTDDGLRKIDQVFAENPELWNTKDPFRAALGFVPDIPSKAGQRGQAQSTGLTPILGANAAVPPVAPPPAASNESKMENLIQEWELATQRGQSDKARQIMAEMDKIHRGY